MDSEDSGSNTEGDSGDERVLQAMEASRRDAEQHAQLAVSQQVRVTSKIEMDMKQHRSL